MDKVLAFSASGGLMVLGASIGLGVQAAREGDKAAAAIYFYWRGLSGSDSAVCLGPSVIATDRFGRGI